MGWASVFGAGEVDDDMELDQMEAMLRGNWGFIKRCKVSDASLFTSQHHATMLQVIERMDSERSVSPGRAALRKAAGAALAKQGEKMKKQALSGAGGKELAVGSVVRVSVTDVDRARTDDPTLTCVVVEANAKGRAKVYTVACKAGVLKERYHAAYLDHVPMMTPLAVGLATVLAGWHGLPKDIALRAATRSQSMVGGQGMLHCACQGKCDTKKCKCKKAGRECSSRCHKSNTQCTNCDK